MALAASAQNREYHFSRLNVDSGLSNNDTTEEVITLNYYKLNTEENPAKPGYGFYRVFLRRRNSEHIFYVMHPPNRDFEHFCLPKSRKNRDGFGNPTQNVVDAFPMVDGRPISESSALFPYNPQDPYANRDPRFRYSIIYNTANWFSTTTNSEIPVFTYMGAQTDGFYQDPGAAEASGYFSRKMLVEGLTANFGTADRNWPLIRYAEILLIKAEALNELNRTSKAYAPIREIRRRTSIITGTDGNYGMQAGTTRENMRSFIQNERRIELFDEDNRCDDVRRWKLATTLFHNKYNKLMSPTKVPVSAEFPTGYKYEVVNSLRLHTFKEKKNLPPFETGEMLSNTALIQNPGWQPNTNYGELLTNHTIVIIY